ncbi:MAG: hypothetical protein K9K86_00410 [Pseudomonadales bacterium]|nr:hypothetical protein [Pseudomonadales bacterium]
MKPDTRQAMLSMINEARASIPFGLSEAELCSGICHGCSKKLLNFLEMELNSWEYRLNQGESPTFGDLQQLAKISRKIYNALAKSGLIRN